MIELTGLSLTAEGIVVPLGGAGGEVVPSRCATNWAEASGRASCGRSRRRGRSEFPRFTEAISSLGNRTFYIGCWWNRMRNDPPSGQNASRFPVIARARFAADRGNASQSGHDARGRQSIALAPVSTPIDPFRECLILSRQHGPVSWTPSSAAGTPDLAAATAPSVTPNPVAGGSHPRQLDAA